jgi:ankyrin repeat protein
MKIKTFLNSQAFCVLLMVSLPISTIAEPSPSSQLPPDVWLTIFNKKIASESDPAKKFKAVSQIPVSVIRGLGITDNEKRREYILRALPALGDVLPWLILNGKLDWAKQLLAAGHDTIDFSVQGSPALVAAAKVGDVDLVRTLITMTKEGRPLVAANAEQSAALFAAVENGHADVVRTLLTEGSEQFRPRANDKDSLALQWAAVKGNAEIVRLLQNEGPQEFRATFHPNSWVYQVVLDKGHTEIANLILAQRPEQSYSLASTRFNHEFDAASSSSDLQVLQLLVKEGSEKFLNPAAVRDHALFPAARNGDTEIVRLLLDEGPEQSRPHADRDESSALFAAVFGGHTEIVKLLLREGQEQFRARPNANDSRALETAIIWGNPEIVKLLLTEGPEQFRAHGNAQNNELLPLAALFGNTEIVRLLLHEGPEQFRARPGAKGYKALREAISRRQTEIVRLLLDAEADLSKAQVVDLRSQALRPVALIGRAEVGRPQCESQELQQARPVALWKTLTKLGRSFFEDKVKTVASKVRDLFSPSRN